MTGVHDERDVLALERATELLQHAARPVCIAGRGVIRAGASTALLALAAASPRLRVASTPGAKGVFPEQHAQALGVFGFSGHASAWDAVRDADVLIVAGSRLFEQSSGDWHPRLREPGVIRIDRDPRYRTPLCRDANLIGDARLLLEQLAAQLGPSSETSLPLAERPRAVPSYPGPFAVDRLVKPQALMNALSRLAPAVPLAADAGNSACWAIEWLERSRPRDLQVSLDWGTMGFALPAAIGISLARDGAPAIALTGDGAMAMSGGDLHTAVELEIPVITLVLNDGGAGMVRAGSEAWFGPNAVPDPDYRYKIDFVKYARSFGARADCVSSLAELEQALGAALELRTPTLLDVHVDPSEAPAAVRERVKGLAGPTAGGVVEGGGMC